MPSPLPRRKTHAALTVWLSRDLLAKFRAAVAAEVGPKPAPRNGDHGAVDVLREFIAFYVALGNSEPTLTGAQIIERYFAERREARP
jgi:hypothetical protein